MLSLAVALLVQAGDNPEFPYWKNHKVGASTKYKLEMSQQGQAVNGEMTRTLLEVKPELCVVERKGRLTVAEQTVELPAEKEDVKAKEEKPEKILKESSEEIEVAGKKMKCRVLETEKDEDGTKVTAKIWANEEIPGGVAKAEVKMADGSMMKLTALSWDKK